MEGWALEREVGEWGVGRWGGRKRGEGRSLVRVWTSEESDRLVTTRAVPATYETKSPSQQGV